MVMRWARVFFGVVFLCMMFPMASAQTGGTFWVGQVWSLRAPMDPAARIHIGLVEDGGQTIHISLWGQPIDDASGLGSPLVAGHLPISADALRRSVDRVANEAPPEDLPFQEGYQTWKDAEGGVFTITVAEIVSLMTETIARGQAEAVE
jgi:hypothetical protein